MDQGDARALLSRWEKKDMDYQLRFTEGLPPQLGTYLFWMWDGMVVEGTYWQRDGKAVVTHYNVVEPTRPEAITQSTNKVRAWAHGQQARPDQEQDKG